MNSQACIDFCCAIPSQIGAIFNYLLHNLWNRICVINSTGMKKLETNWLTEGLIDFEYKKYVMLAYLQQVQKQFEAVKLYPSFSELLEHYKNLLEVKTGKEGLASGFPTEVKGLDMDRLSLSKEQTVSDDEIMLFITELVDYALPRFKDSLVSAKEIFDFVESQLEIEHVGIQPLYNREGYLFVYDEDAGDIFIYQYESSLIETSTEKFRALKTNFLYRERKTLSRSFESLKLNLIQKFKVLPNPATWLVTSHLQFPLVETYLPVTKRLLMQRLHSAA
jgi:hypothetical protein